MRFEVVTGVVYVLVETYMVRPGASPKAIKVNFTVGCPRGFAQDKYGSPSMRYPCDFCTGYKLVEDREYLGIPPNIEVSQ